MNEASSHNIRCRASRSFIVTGGLVPKAGIERVRRGQVLNLPVELAMKWKEEGLIKVIAETRMNVGAKEVK